MDLPVPDPEVFPSSAPSAVPPAGLDRRWRLAALGLILVLGLALRVVGLGSTPRGFWFDEALNGIDAWHAATGDGLHLVYPNVFPREPMFETLLAGAVWLGGPRVVVLRAVPVAIGTLTLLLLYLMLRRETGEPLALTAAAVLAGMRWHALMSRLVFRTIILPPWLILIVWAALACRRRPSAPRLLLLGALIGGGFYTYLAWYFMLPLAGLLAWWACEGETKSKVPRSNLEQDPRAHLNAERGMRNMESEEAGTPHGPDWFCSKFDLRISKLMHFRRICLVCVAALLVAAPLLVAYIRDPALILARPGAVSVFAGGWSAGLREIARNAGEALLMFHWFGDHVAVQNVPHAAALGPIQGAIFVWGLVVCSVAIRRRRALPLILLGWIACGMATTIFTHTDSPNFLRSLAMAPAAAVVVALGLVDLARRVLARRAWMIVVPLLLASGAISAARITAWGRLPEVRARYQAEIVAMGNVATERGGPATAVFVPDAVRDSLPFQFATLTAVNLHLYSGLQPLAPWREVASASGAPVPERRLIFLFGGSPLLDQVRRGRAPGAWLDPLAETFPDEAGPRIVAGALLVPESALPAR